MVARITQDLRSREPNLAALLQYDVNDTFDPAGDRSGANTIPGKRASQWVLLARNAKHFSALNSLPLTMPFDGRSVRLAAWDDLPESPNAPLWTDDFSNLTQILNWEQILPWMD